MLDAAYQGFVKAGSDMRPIVPMSRAKARMDALHDVNALMLSEEVLVRASEDHVALPLVRRIMARIMELLRASGLYWGGMTLADVDGLIQASARNLQKGGQPRDERGRFSKVKYSRSPVATIKGDELGPYAGLQHLRDKARTYARSHLVGKVIRNQNTGFDILIPWQGIKHTLSGALTEEKLLSIPALPALLQHGALVSSEADKG